MSKRFISWNVNGIRAALKKNFMEFFRDVDADVFAVQELKAKHGQVQLDLPGYYQYWNYAGKAGYSGTAVFTKERPLSFSHGLNIPDPNRVLEDDEANIFEYSQEFIAADEYTVEEAEDVIIQMQTEGRVITLEFPEYYFLTVDTPNSQNALARLDKRQLWDVAFTAFVSELDKIKPVIISGDLNVAHNEIDLKNPDTNHMSAGFSDEEREGFTNLLAAGFTDTFRHFLPDATDRYSWWSYRTFARRRNAGWRIDYFVTSERLNERLERAEILDQVMGSDHCPVILEMK